MLVFGTEMHLVTFIFLVAEVLMFFYQIIHYLQRPQDKGRKYYLILLFLLIIYNLTGGLFPDPKLPLPIITQNIIAYGTGFFMGSFFPYYFYKGFDLNSLRFHALYGTFCFLIAPYLLFFVIVYSLNGDLDFAIKNGIIVPFFYSFVLLVAIIRAIRKKYKENPNSGNFWEMMAVYAAVVPWATLTPFSYFKVSQFWEVLFTNGGLVVITILFINRSVKLARVEYDAYITLQNRLQGSDHFQENCKRFGLTTREAEIAKLIREGNTYKDIAERLFISEKTVSAHIQNIYEKTEVSNRSQLVYKLIN